MTAPTYSRSDFQTDQEVRWCPGCGDYTILAAVQGFMANMGVAREKIVFVSGIGCSSRFPYYMNTYGMHSIHGRAPAIASGIAATRPDLSVWVVTGDGDALSIGGNHLIHSLRRNFNLKILLFNNQIYGLTKGQYSPTSEVGKHTKSTPMGSVDYPFNPISLALGAESSFVARTIDMDRTHTTEILQAAYDHQGTAFIEIYQNCNVFNDKAFIQLTGKEEKADQPDRPRPWQTDHLRSGRRQSGHLRRRAGPDRRHGERRSFPHPGPRSEPGRSHGRFRPIAVVSRALWPDPDGNLPQGRPTDLRERA